MNLYSNTAKYYDLVDINFQNEDLGFYKEYIDNIEQPILELGCGTGRVSLWFAEQGYNVTALDLSEAMLQQFYAKILQHSVNTNYLNIVHADMTDFELNQKYQLIIAPNRAFQAICDLSCAESALRCMVKHSMKNGSIIIDLFNPIHFLNEEYCYKETIVLKKRIRDDIITMKYKCIYIDKINQVVYSQNTIIHESDGNRIEIIDRNKLRYYFPHQILQLMKKCGLEIVQTYGWYDKSSMNNNRKIIVVSKPKY